MYFTKTVPTPTPAATSREDPRLRHATPRSHFVKSFEASSTLDQNSDLDEVLFIIIINLIIHHHHQASLEHGPCAVMCGPRGAGAGGCTYLTYSEEDPSCLDVQGRLTTSWGGPWCTVYSNIPREGDEIRKERLVPPPWRWARSCQHISVDPIHHTTHARSRALFVRLGYCHRERARGQTRTHGTPSSAGFVVSPRHQPRQLATLGQYQTAKRPATNQRDHLGSAGLLERERLAAMRYLLHFRLRLAAARSVGIPSVCLGASVACTDETDHQTKEALRVPVQCRSAGCRVSTVPRGGGKRCARDSPSRKDKSSERRASDPKPEEDAHQSACWNVTWRSGWEGPGSMKHAETPEVVPDEEHERRT
ncbi:hypothetical protein BJY52DRAFT_1227424 [Lactarius psammicola]|nr:hypothetical protein BJY52DRAFT_1227424 [Lactarius psammicola]